MIFVSEIVLTIDGKKVMAGAGETVLAAARRAGIGIPTLCEHGDLPPFGGCRMCVVEIDEVRGYPTSCTTPAAAGMVVRTDTPALRELRQMVLEMVLSGHPNSCLVCQDREACERHRPRPTKSGRATRCGACSNRSGCAVRGLSLAGGERLLNLSTIYSAAKVERHEPFIDRDHNLCILCARCWRACEQIQGRPVISILHRGAEARVGAAFDMSWQEAGCTYCGACVDLCPTGTLTDRFARWFDVSGPDVATACALCGHGCRLRATSADGKLVSTRMSRFTREERICAAGRFAYAQLLNDPNRLVRPELRMDGELTPVEWEEAIAAIAGDLAAYRGALAVVTSALDTRENIHAYARFAEAMGGRLVRVSGADDAQLAEWRAGIGQGTVKAAIVAGNLLDEADASALQYLLLIDCLPSAVGRAAAAVLPAAVLGETGSTFVRADGQPASIHKVAQPPGEARAECEILAALAKAMGIELPAVPEGNLQASSAAWDQPAVPPAHDPRGDAAHTPSRFRGHLLADSAPNLRRLGLPSSADRRAPLIAGFEVLAREEVVPNFHRLVLRAPTVAQFAKPGQFAIVMAGETSERVPFTLVDWDAAAGTITLIVEEVGRASRELAELQAGDFVAHVAGPLGSPLPVRNYGTVALAGGCYGIAAIYPLAKALKAAGNRVIGVIEGCSAHMLYFEDELSGACDQLVLVTKDGSRGIKGGVQDVLPKLVLPPSAVDRGGAGVDLLVAIGCTFMMEMVAGKTRSLGVPLQVALNPIMVDGTGMCGACRVSVGGQTRFACVDGPLFDGHAVDFAELSARRAGFRNAELTALAHDHGEEMLPVVQG